jgi:hypothetical protein
VFLRSLPDYTVVDDPEELRHFVTGEEAAEEAVG